MKIRAVAFDFDGTIAPDQEPLRSALMIDIICRLADAGVKVILNTGRDIDYTIGPDGISDPAVYRRLAAIICEGGAVIWDAERDRVEELAPRRSHELVAEMRRLKIPSSEIWADHCAVMSTRANAPIIETAIANVNAHRLASGVPPLDLVPVLNNGSSTYLPRGVNKLTGLLTVLGRLGITPAETMGCGDGINDADWLAVCGVAVVPANGVAELKRLRNAVVTRGRDARGMAEVLGPLLAHRMRIDPPQQGQREVA